VVAPHGRGGAIKQAGDPFVVPATPTTSKQTGAQGGNRLLLDGSVNWKNISKMTNYWSSHFGGEYWNAW